MSSSSMVSQMLSNWLGQGVNDMEVRGVKESARDLKKVFDRKIGHELAIRSVARRFVIKALPMHLAIVSACAITMTAYASSTVTLTGINTTALPNNETELRLAFDGTPPNPQAYQLDKPARLVVDLPNAKVV